MKRKIIIVTIILLIAAAGLYAKGKTQETEKKPQNAEWFLCITEFDSSSLPLEKQIISQIFTKSLADKLKNINYRLRVAPEYAYYEGQAWAAARTAAAKALLAKLDERTLLLYKGDANWKYRQELVKKDQEIAKLKEAYEKVESEAPLIESKPVFQLISGNLSDTFPPAPKEGGEFKFCKDQKAESFLAGTITDFHGRYYVVMKLYTLYTKSFAYEDDVIFSPEDLDKAVGEIADRLVLALSGNQPAALAVHAEPLDASVLINKSFAARGDTGVMEYPPGKVSVTASAENYESMTVETELEGGELANIRLNLKPLTFGNVHITGIYDSGSVYQGAMYAGSTPLTLQLPLNQMEYIELEPSKSDSGKAVFHTPAEPGATSFLALPATAPSERGSVNKARRWYYRGWGGTWITGIMAMIAYGLYTSYDEAYKAKGGAVSEDFNNQYKAMNVVFISSLIAAGLAGAHEVFQIGRYVYISNKNSTPYVKTSSSGR
ncbi:MAG: hypothetical protein LBU82_06060 [Treponema sp.]|nr:hypothetical protein [Treponema sp.]